MKLFFKALGLTVGMLMTALIATVAVVAMIHSAVGLLAFPVTLFLSLLTCLMDELGQQRR